jgi:hypothetical protein
MARLFTGRREIVFALAIIALAFAIWSAVAIKPASAEEQVTKYQGILADVLCATRGTALDGADMMKHPEKHTVGCLKEPPCKASGYGVLTKGPDGTFVFHKFDKKGNELALGVIDKTKKSDNVSVEVTGQMKEGIIGVNSIVEK